jgi:hypothetical protein
MYDKMSAKGWVYCISNPSMPGLLKIGMTLRTPQERLAEANSSDTWRSPTKFAIEFAKKVCDPLQKERTIHRLLEQYDQRVNPKREFFQVGLTVVHLCFELMEGEWMDIEVPGAAPPATKPKKPRASKKKPVVTSDYLKTLTITSLLPTETDALISIALDTRRIRIQINGVTYSFEQFSTMDVTWFIGKIHHAFLWKDEAYVYAQTQNIDDIIMELSNQESSHLLIDARVPDEV